MSNPYVSGTLQAIGGATEATIGVATTVTSYGTLSPLGMALTAHGSDHFFTGIRTIIEGRHIDSATSQLLQKTGLSHNAATNVDSILSIAGTGFGLKVLRAAQLQSFPLHSLPEHTLTGQYTKYNSNLSRTGSTSRGSAWVLPKERGGALINKRWYTEHAIERMAPKTPQVMAELESRALARAAAKGLTPGTEAFGDWWMINGPSPRGIPPLVVEAEIANPGSTNIRVFLNQCGDVITIIPGGK